MHSWSGEQGETANAYGGTGGGYIHVRIRQEVMGSSEVDPAVHEHRTLLLVCDFGFWPIRRRSPFSCRTFLNALSPPSSPPSSSFSSPIFHLSSPIISWARPILAKTNFGQSYVCQSVFGQNYFFSCCTDETRQKQENEEKRRRIKQESRRRERKTKTRVIQTKSPCICGNVASRRPTTFSQERGRLRPDQLRPNPR